ncbi:MAG: hypothetical protein ACYS9X_07835 [Planctomycetota bacterium]|jgi:hypothetical protein
MPTKRDHILGRLAVDLGYLTHEQIGRAFLDHQRMVEQQGMDVSFTQMLVVQDLLTGERARLRRPPPSRTAPTVPRPKPRPPPPASLKNRKSAGRSGHRHARSLP